MSVVTVKHWTGTAGLVERSLLLAFLQMKTPSVQSAVKIELPGQIVAWYRLNGI